MLFSSREVGFYADKLPIDSGVTEASCKILLKQHLCDSGTRWKDKGSQLVLSLELWSQVDGFSFGTKFLCSELGLAKT